MTELFWITGDGFVNRTKLTKLARGLSILCPCVPLWRFTRERLWVAALLSPTSKYLGLKVLTEPDLGFGVFFSLVFDDSGFEEAILGSFYIQAEPRIKSASCVHRIHFLLV